MKFFKFTFLLSVGALTFNVNDKDPTQDTDRARTLCDSHFIKLQECDIFAIILQEVDMSLINLFTNEIKLNSKTIDDNKDTCYPQCEGKSRKWLEYFNVILNTLDI